jgi:hypothetical protein
MLTASARAVVCSVGVSLGMHLLAWLWVRHFAALPGLGFEWKLPDAVEFGVYESAPTVAPQTQAVVATQQSEADRAPSSLTPQNADSTRPTPRRRPKPQPSEAAAADSGGVEATTPHATTGALESLSPAGAQLALKIDLDRVRDSPLAQDAEALLVALPDVRMLLDGSDVAPLRDLSRLFLASPDLRRSHVVMAGRYRGDESLPRQAVAKLAAAHGTTASWRLLRGIAVAPWSNQDATARVLALLGPNLFAITREEDLARVLSVARSITRRKQPKPSSASNDAQALVAMADHELLVFCAENAKRFVRGARTAQTPDRLEVSVLQTSPEAIQVEAHATFPNVEEAAAAQRFWDELRQRYADHPLVALVGLDGVLRQCTLALHGTAIEARTTLPMSRARLLLGFARDALSRTLPDRSGNRPEHDASAIQ